MGADLAPHLEVSPAGRITACTTPSTPIRTGARSRARPRRSPARAPRTSATSSATRRPGKIAAFIAEPIQGVGGATQGAPNYLREAYADRARARRALHRRRSADRLRPHRRALLGLRELRRRARHRHDGQGDRQRLAARRRHHAAGDRRGDDPPHPLQHLRRQSGLDGRGARRARHHRRGRPAGELRAWSGGRLKAGLAGAADAPPPHRRRARHGPDARRRAGARPGDQGAGDAGDAGGVGGDAGDGRAGRQGGAVRQHAPHQAADVHHRGGRGLHARGAGRGADAGGAC